MHFAEAGAGDPIVLLHGWPQHWWAWRRLIPPLAECHRVVCPDLRGFGWSDAPAGRYAKEELAADVVALMDALELDRVRLVGHDWGGLVGFLLCMHRPERVVRYLALNAPHPFVSLGVRAAAGMWRSWYQALIAAPVLGVRLLSGGGQALPRLIYRWSTVNRQAWSGEDTEMFLAQLREPARARASVALYRTYHVRELPRSIGAQRALPRLTTPTLCLHGAGDPILRPWFVRQAIAHADDLTVELVDGAGHFVAEERADFVARRALDHFARN